MGGVRTRTTAWKVRAAGLLIVLASTIGLAACGSAFHDRAEFAPPESRWPATLPSPARVNDPAPAIAERYCYRTLADVDCYATAQPNLLPSYVGEYPDAPAQGAPVKR